MVLRVYFFRPKSAYEMRISDGSSDVCSSGLSGLPEYGGLARYHADVAAGAAPWPVDRLLAETEADRLRYPPGAGWAYSNIGYMKAGALIAQASGLPLGVALQQLVLDRKSTRLNSSH